MGQPRHNLRRELASDSHQESELGKTKSLQDELQFSKPEEILRYDASETEVPEVIFDRLQESIKKSPRPNRSWWRRWIDRTR